MADKLTKTNINEQKDKTDREKVRANQPKLPSMPEKPKMKCVRRQSVNEIFEVCPNSPIPNVPTGGARVKVRYAGACYTNEQVLKTGQRRPKIPGIKDTSLFPGYEVSGTIDALCNSVTNNNWKVGDRVIVYPGEGEIGSEGFDEYIIVKDVKDLIKIPDTLSLEVASLLPCGALTAYSAILKAKDAIEYIRKTKEGLANVLIVGAGGLGLWTLSVAKHYIESSFNNVSITVADVSIEKLMVAEEYGCTGVVHWHEAIHEPYICQRTLDVCNGGVDVAIDFVSSPRTISRAMQVLNENGFLIVGGNSRFEVSFGLNELARKQQSILGVSRGTREQLVELTEAVAEGKITAPCFSVFPVEEANEVFEQLNECSINGRAVFEISADTSS